MENITLNIMGKLMPATEKKRDNRAYDGVCIAMRSVHHQDKIASELKGLNQETKDFVHSKVHDVLKQGKNKAFKDINQNFDILFPKIDGSKVDKDQAKLLFHKIKEQANIVASSSGAMLLVGKLTSRLSDMPLIRSVASGMNQMMRTVFDKSFLKNIMGDEDINKTDNDGLIISKNGEAVFRVNTNQPAEQPTDQPEDTAKEQITNPQEDNLKEKRDSAISLLNLEEIFFDCNKIKKVMQDFNEEVLDYILENSTRFRNMRPDQIEHTFCLMRSREYTRKFILEYPDRWDSYNRQKREQTSSALSDRYSSSFVIDQAKRWDNYDDYKMLSTCIALNEGEYSREFVLKSPNRWDGYNGEQMRALYQALNKSEEIKEYILDNFERFDKSSPDQQYETFEALHRGEHSRKFVIDQVERWDNYDESKMLSTSSALNDGENSREFVLESPDRWDGYNGSQMFETHIALKSDKFSREFVLEGPDRWDSYNKDQMYQTRAVLSSGEYSRDFIFNNPDRWDQYNGNQMRSLSQALNKSEAIKDYILNHFERFDKLSAGQQHRTFEALCGEESSRKLVIEHPEYWDNMPDNIMHITRLVLDKHNDIGNFVLENLDLWTTLSKEQIEITLEAFYDEDGYNSKEFVLANAERWCAYNPDQMAATREALNDNETLRNIVLANVDNGWDRLNDTEMWDLIHRHRAQRPQRPVNEGNLANEGQGIHNVVIENSTRKISNILNLKPLDGTEELFRAIAESGVWGIEKKIS